MGFPSLSYWLVLSALPTIGLTRIIEPSSSSHLLQSSSDLITDTGVAGTSFVVPSGRDNLTIAEPMVTRGRLGNLLKVTPHFRRRVNPFGFESLHHIG